MDVYKITRAGEQIGNTEIIHSTGKYVAKKPSSKQTSVDKYIDTFNKSTKTQSVITRLFNKIKNVI